MELSNLSTRITEKEVICNHKIVIHITKALLENATVKNSGIQVGVATLASISS